MKNTFQLIEGRDWERKHFEFWKMQDGDGDGDGDDDGVIVFEFGGIWSLRAPRQYLFLSMEDRGKFRYVQDVDLSVLTFNS